VGTFSYYGMPLLVLFLTSSLAKGGWAWSIEDAMYGIPLYTMFVYFP
jgi:POT family proton-dependent oligopeptide transporter